MRLNGKTALVTGAASGFGLEIANRFAAEGAKVALADINGPGAEAAADRIGEAAIAIECDVSVASEVGNAVDAAIGSFGRLDIAVNNAGWSHRNQPLLDVDEDQFRRVYEINVFSIYHMTRSVVPHWRVSGTGGVMLNIGSTAGIRPRPGLTWYNSTKGAVHLMTKSLAAELAPDGVRVCAIAPVLGNTALRDTFLGDDSPETIARFLATVPLGRLSEPHDIANAALFLASDEADFLTGVVLEVDGGRCI